MGFPPPPNKQAFDQAVWQVVARIPGGKVITYGQIARWLAYPAGIPPHTYDVLSARWVGGAMAHCPEDLPWHRVVNSQWKISPREGAAIQLELLESEGIKFRPNGSINLRQYAWEITE